MPASQDPEKRAKQLANLRSFADPEHKKKINRAGRPKGTKSWASIVQNMLGDEILIDKIIKQKPSYWDTLEQKNAANAIVATMIVKALQGSKEAAEWLRKTGFGDKFVHELEDGFFEKTKLTIEVVQPKHAEETEEPDTPEE